jgi:hypothetical protein
MAPAHCHSIGVRFGAGDTEFIPWSDGNGCCGSSDLFLDANQFDGNFVGAIKHALKGTPSRLEFSYFATKWLPSETVGFYMDYRARIPPSERDGKADWLQLLRRRWNGGRSPYSPAFFDGVVRSNDTDELGLSIYDASALAAEPA